MAAVGNKAVSKAVEKLTATEGLASSVAAIAEREQLELSAISASQVVAQNVAFELAEKTAGVKYPAVYVYCEGLANLLKEKFRTFSGKVYMAVEVRASHDRLEGVGASTQYYVEAVTEVLDNNRGEWSPGVYYTGGYKVEFGPIRHGGKNFLQAAKVRFELEVSMN
ncbi:MAG: hypothetical protein AAB225_17395 [Acidobacteriota bacterium]